jgi:hypothetical protein
VLCFSNHAQRPLLRLQVWLPANVVFADAGMPAGLAACRAVFCADIAIRDRNPTALEAAMLITIMKNPHQPDHSTLCCSFSNHNNHCHAYRSAPPVNVVFVLMLASNVSLQLGVTMITTKEESHQPDHSNTRLCSAVAAYLPNTMSAGLAACQRRLLC